MVRKAKKAVATAISIEDAMSVTITQVPSVVETEKDAVQSVQSVQSVAADDSCNHVIIQLPIPASRIDKIVDGPQDYTQVPLPYSPINAFGGENSEVHGRTSTEHSACFWCCHPIPVAPIGMPTGYDVIHESFTTFGSFCSLECAAAFNFSTNQGSDRVWEIHSWILLLGKRMGCADVRPAPSRYLLKMFGGTMTIDEFRVCHKGAARTFLLNIPPLITVNTQMESVNTSFLTGQNIMDMDRVHERTKLFRHKNVVDTARTLEGKMNLTLTV